MSSVVVGSVGCVVSALPTHGTGHVVFVWTVAGSFCVVAAPVLWFRCHLPRD
jgi:hypothetical protein